MHKMSRESFVSSLNVEFLCMGAIYPWKKHNHNMFFFYGSNPLLLKAVSFIRALSIKCMTLAQRLLNSR